MKSNLLAGAVARAALAASRPRTGGARAGPCACDASTSTGHRCAACAEQSWAIQRRPATAGTLSAVPPIVGDVLRSPGRPLAPEVRAFVEPRFRHDFGQVRIHTDSAAAESARAVSAQAYAVGRHIVFASGQFDPASRPGRWLLAHELAHTVQQRMAGAPAPGPPWSPAHSAAEAEAGRVADAVDRGATSVRVGEAPPAHVARLCTSAATCAPGVVIPGAAEDFGRGEETREVGPRARRKRMTPARAVSTGHAGRALQLERFLSAQDPTRLANIQGIFIDQDMSAGSGAFTQRCADWIAAGLPAGSPTPPGMAGAAKPCTFVHGIDNQEALLFNTSAAPTIGSRSRDRWRIDTLQLVTHETEHPRFEAATAAAPLPAGVTTATCSRANVQPELSEIAAGLSEFPAIFRPASAEANPAGPLHVRLTSWFGEVARTGDENVSGALTRMGCSCNCPEVDAHVRATFTEVTTSNAWTAAERAAFNARMRAELPVGPRPSWPL